MADESVLLGQLAEEFSTRVRRGELPGVEEYAARHPGLAERIRALFPTLLLLEGLAGGAAQPTPSSADLPPGTVFGGYQIERELGRGGMGVVYEAIHLALQRRVALKVLPLHGPRQAQQLERFLREAQTAAGLHHTNIVPVFDVGQVGGVPYYAMQLIRGCGLDKLGTAGEATVSHENAASSRSAEPRRTTATPAGSLSPARLAGPTIASLGIQAAEALAHAHARGVIHRDIKPSNLLLDEEGVLWITDFGLARRLDDVALTHTGQLLGTPRYMSPEQAQAATQPVDHRTDIYSLGATLYELLARRPAFDGKTPQEVVLQIIDREPVPPSRFSAGVPRDLETIVLKALAKRPEDRYQTAQALADDLRRFTQGEPIQARRINFLGRVVRLCRRYPLVTGVTAIALLTIITLTAGYTWSLWQEQARTLEALGQLQQQEKQTRLQEEQGRQRLARHYVSNGVRAMDADDLLGSLPWFAEALRLEEQWPERADIHRRRLAAVLNRCPRLQQVWFHDGPVLQVVFSADGRRVLTAGADRVARVWDAVTGAPVGPPLKHDYSVTRAELTTDGRRALTVACTGDEHQPSIIHFWDVEKGQNLTPPLRQPQQPRAATISGDGRRVVIVRTPDGKAEGSEIRCLDAGTGRLVGTPFTSTRHIFGVRPSPDGRWFVLRSYGLYRGTVVEEHHQLLDAETGKVMPVPDLKYPVAFTRDGQRLLIHDRGPELEKAGSFQMWNPATLRPLGPAVANQAGPGSGNSADLLSPDGRLLLRAGPGLVVIELQTGRVVAVWHGFSNAVVHAQFSPNGKQVLALTQDGRWRRLHLAEGSATGFSLPEGPPAYASWGCLSPDGQHLLALQNRTESPVTPNGPGWLALKGGGAEQPSSARLWDSVAGQPVSPPLHHGGQVRHAAFSPDGSRVVTAGDDGCARLWDVAVRQLTLQPQDRPSTGWQELGAALRDGYGPAVAQALSPDGRRLARTYGQSGAEVVELATGKITALIQVTSPHQDETATGKWSFDSRFYMTTAATGDRLWDAISGQERRPPLKPGQRIALPWLGPTGSRVLLSQDELDKEGRNRVEVWDVAAGRTVVPAITVDGVVWDAAFSADGRRLLLLVHSGGRPRRVQVHEAATGRPAGPPLLHEHAVCSAAFSPNGELLVTTEHQSTRALVWDLARGRTTPASPLQYFAALQGAWFSPDGHRIVTHAVDDSYRIWDARTGKPVTPPLDFGTSSWEPAFSADGRLLLTRTARSARVWDAATGEPVTPLLPDSSGRAAFNADGRRLLALSSYLGPAFFTTDGEHLTSYRDSRAARVWDLAPDPRPTAELQRLVQVLSARRVDETGHLVPLESARLRQHWATLHAPTAQPLPTSTPAQRRAWRLQMLDGCTLEGRLFHLNHLLAEQPTAWLHYERGNLHRELSNWSQAAADYTRAIELGEDSHQLRFGRAQAWAELGRWREAGDVLEQNLDREQFRNYRLPEQLALCRLAGGQLREYQQFCQQLAERLRQGEITDPDSHWPLALGPCLPADAARVVPQLEKAIGPMADYSQYFIAGALLFRQGKYPEALARLEQSVKLQQKGGNTYDWLFLAMTQQRLGKDDEAREWLAKSQKALDVGPVPRWQSDHVYTDWERRLAPALLRREAEELIRGK